MACLEVLDLGLIDYNDCLKRQFSVLEQVKKGVRGPVLLICQHYPVITLGRTGSMDNLLADLDKLNSLNIKFLQVNRGGDITAHEPGQLVAYPIFDLACYNLKDIRLFLMKVETVIISSLNEFGAQAFTIASARGVFTKQGKIASIGVAFKNWVSFHGFSINVSNDCQIFSLIKACGLETSMVSLSNILGKKIDFEMVKKSVIKNVKKEFLF